MLGAADEHVGLDADLAQLLDRVLRGLRLQLAARAQVRDERQVDERDVLAADLERELPDGLEEGQPLDVADRAADLADEHVGVADAAPDARLDLVGDVRDHLHRLAEVVAAALLRDDRLVDLARRVVAVLGQRRVGEALVVPEVEVGLGAVVGHVHLAVLVRRHRPRIDVDVRVELLVRDLEAVRLEQEADRGARQPLSEARGHAAGHEDELRHPLLPGKAEHTPRPDERPGRARGRVVGAGGDGRRDAGTLWRCAVAVSSLPLLALAVAVVVWLTQEAPPAPRAPVPHRGPRRALRHRA